MRIVGGDLKGRRLAPPKDRRVRPSTDRTREALFNVLAHADLGGFSLQGARVLDLFAGTGALGLEALSRGAAFALFIDDAAASRALIRTNAEMLALLGQIKIYRRDAVKLGPKPASAGPPFDLVFADPPYGKGLGTRALAIALAGGWLAPGAIAVLEEAAEAEIGELAGFKLLDRRRYGDTQILIFSQAEQNSAQ